jgi:hypothetical protein
MRHAKQPRRNRVTRPYIRSPPREYKEGRLERIFGIMLVSQNSLARCEDQIRMTGNQNRERGFISREKRGEQLRVGRSIGRKRQSRELREVAIQFDSSVCLRR